MSKKMLKRSLALGALMAFVITGSAMAKNITAEEILPEYVGRVFVDVNGNHCEYQNNTLNGTGSETVTLLPKTDYVGQDNYQYPLRTWGASASTTVSNISELIISGDHTGNDTDSQDGLRGPFYAGGGGVLTLGTEDAKIGTIKTADDAKVGIVFNTQGGTINVNANTVDVKASSNAVLINLSLADAPESNITIKAAKINIESDGYAIYGYDPNNRGCEVEINASDKLNIIGSNGAVLSCNGSVGVSAKDIYIEGGTYGAVYSFNDGNVDVIAADGGKAVLLGDVSSYGTSEVDVNLGTGGSLTGAVYTGDSSTSSLDLGTNSTWTATGNSEITNVTGDGTIKVDMVSDDSVASVKVKGISSGIATFGATSRVTDYLASLSGENQETAMKKVVESVTDANGNALTDTVTTDEGMVTGAYTISMDGNTVTYNEAVNTKSDAVSDAGMTLKGHWRAHMNDMNKRMGELRMANGEHGVWTRMVRGESEYQGAKMQYNQYQLGYDEKLSVDKRWTVGAAVTFSEGDASYGSGSTDDKSTAFAIYGSKLNNDGTFVDLIARYAHLESDLDDRNYGTGDYSTNGMSVSAEFGKRIQQGNGLWIEPQVELTYGTVDSADVAFSKSYKAHYDSMDSFIARAGFALGKDIKQGNVYARASYLYDFDGETETQFEGGKAISEDFGGGWWEVGVGANINLSKATYIYADIEKTFGGEVDTNWQWNLGVRYSF